MRRVLLVIWYFINAFTPITLDIFDFVILVFALSNGRECRCKTAKVHGDRHIKGAKVPGSEKAGDRKRQGTNWPGSEKAREQKGQGAKVPGNASARERKGSVPFLRTPKELSLTRSLVTQ